jgi:hypothetical protein
MFPLLINRILFDGIFFLGYFTELQSDLTLALKIFVLLTIISFIMQHVGKGPLAIILILGISWFVIFDYFLFFGGMYVLYVMLTFGVTSIIIDFFFINPGAGGGEPPTDISHGIDFAQRQATFNQARQSVANQISRGRR